MLLHGLFCLLFGAAYRRRHRELVEVFRGQSTAAILAGAAMAGLGEELVFRGLSTSPLYLAGALVLGAGFLASWLARHKPIQVAIAAVALAAISISGDSLQIDSGLPAASVNILMALVLLAVFGWTGRKASA